MNFDDDTKDLFEEMEEMLRCANIPDPPELLRQDAVAIDEIDPHWTHYQETLDLRPFAIRIPPGKYLINFK